MVCPTTHHVFRKTLLATLLIPLFSSPSAWAERTENVSGGSSLTLTGEYESNSGSVITVDGANSVVNAGSGVIINNTTSTGYDTVKVTNGGTINFNDVNIIATDHNVSAGAVIGSNNGTVNLTDGTVNGKYEKYLLNVTDSSVKIDGTQFNFDNNSYGDAAVRSTNSDIELNNTHFNINKSGSYTVFKIISGSLTGSNNEITTNSLHVFSVQNDGLIHLNDTKVNVNGSSYVLVNDSGSGRLIFDELNINGNLSHNDRYAVTNATTSGSSTLTNSSISLDTGNGFFATKGELFLDNVNVTITNGTGLRQSGGHTSTIVNSTFETHKNAIYSTNAHLVISGSQIATTGDGASAVTTVNSNATTTITNSELIANGLNSAVLDNSYGASTTLDNVVIRHNGVQGGSLISINAGSITGTNVNATATGNNTNGIFTTYSNSNVALTDSSITVKGADASGIAAYGTTAGHKITLDNSAVISEQHTGVLAAGGIIDLELKNGAVISGGNDLLFHAQSYNGKDSQINVTADNNVYLNGNILQEANNTVSLALDNGSVWQGSTTLTNAVSIGQDSRWNMTDNSSVQDLALQNDGMVVFAGTGTPYQRLEAANLSGNGHFVMRTDIVGDIADRLSVTGSSAGDHKLTVTNSGSAATDGSEVLTVIDTADGVGQFALTNDVELGGYIYKLRQNANDWELYASGPRGPLTSTADASANTLNVGYLLNFAENQTLLQRMGQLRTNEADGNVWLRGYGGNFNSFGGEALNGFRMNYYSTQLGADKQWQKENGISYFGVMLGLSHSSPRYVNADGKVKNHHAGLYAGYLSDNGFYIDSVLKYNHMRTNINAKDTAGTDVAGRSSVNGYAFSVEAGQRFHLMEENSGVYVEPQAQIHIFRQEKSHFNNSNGLRVNLSGYTSALGRVGGLIGFDVKDSPTPINFYFKSAYLREFSGNADFSLNGSQEKHSFKGDWWLNGVGASVEVRKKHNFYMDMEKLTGDKFNQNQLNVGYRYNF